MYVCIYLYILYLYIFYIYFIDFYVIFNEKSKKMKKMRVCVRECGGAPPVFVDDLFCKLLYTLCYQVMPSANKIKNEKIKKVEEELEC